MPLVDTADQLPEGDRAALPAPPADTAPAPSGLDVAAAAERQGNVAGMLYDRYIANPKPDAAAVPGFDPLASVPKGYEPYATRFLDAQSPQEVQWIRGRIDQELTDRQTIARAGGWGVAATLAAGATDPLTIASMAIPAGGVTRLAQAARLAAIGVGTTAAQEGLAQGLSETRTPQESLTNIATSAILGGVLGAAIRPKVSAEDFASLRANMDAATRGPVNAGDSTAGAAAVASQTLEQNTIATGAKTLAEGTIGQVSPGLRLLTSPSLEARSLVQQLSETHEMLEKNLQGIATPTAIETLLRGHEGDWWQAWKARGEAYRTYAERIQGEGGSPIGKGDFGAEIAYAMRRGDEHDIPEVADAAKQTRAIVFDPLKERASKLGLLPEDVTAEGADSYLMRQYDVQKIRANQANWLDTLTNGFVAQGVERSEASDIAHVATRNILGSERGTMDWKVLDDVVPKSGRLQERTLKLPDQVLEPYLVNDIDHLSHSYLRSLAPEVEMVERFGAPDVQGIRGQYDSKISQLSQMAGGEHGVPEEVAGNAAAALRSQMQTETKQALTNARNLEPQLAAVRDEYSRLMEQARAEGKDSALTALSDRRDADIRDLKAIRDRLYGIYGQPKDPGAFFVRAGRFIRGWNALRDLGAATLSHFPDIANVITRYGLGNTFAALAKLGTSLDAIKLSRLEARRMGVGLDMVMNMTAARLGDYGSHSRFAEQRFMQKATRGFTISTLETPLITTVQSLASVLGQDDVLKSAQRLARGELIPERQLARLAVGGIDRDMLQRIAGQSGHWEEVNGLHFGHSDQWPDQKAAQAFESSILKDAHAMTLSPGAGDLPLTMSGEAWKFVRQFQSFSFAATRHVLMPLAQGIAAGDVRAMNGLMALLASGYLSYYTKQKTAGQPIETNPMRLALEVLDRSNLTGWTGQAIFPALWAMGFKDLSRWSDRDAVETFLGPGAGTLADIWQRRFPAKFTAATAAGDQGLDRNDLHFLRRLMPAQNLWYFRRAANGLEDSVGDLFNLPGESQEQREAANQ